MFYFTVWFLEKQSVEFDNEINFINLHCTIQNMKLSNVSIYSVSDLILQGERAERK